ncbi:hypothetical protein DL96DRAFT_1710985 [Flagelloscypha sp. PMI_526]|nr:hypothetical protein DL96DRAFT_1710985 [Flagelloscypha sp. PMI_526]
MSSSLPTDLYAEILQYLSGKHLKSCSLVCSDFLPLARRLLSWNFNNHDRERPWSRAPLSPNQEMKDICLNARSLVLVEEDINPDLPQWFPNLYHLSLLYSLYSVESFPPMAAFSQVYSLSLARMTSVPLMALFVTFPALRRLELLDVEFDASVPPTSYENAPELDYLAINDIKTLRGANPFTKYLEYKCKSIRSLRLNCTWEYNHPASTYFVPYLKPFLQHLFIGSKFYHFITIMINHPSNARFCIPFAELPLLQTLMFETDFPDSDVTWTRWLSYIALQLQHKAPSCLRNIEFRSSIRSQVTRRSKTGSHVLRQDHEVNAFAERSQTTLVFVLQTRWSGDVRKDTQRTTIYDNSVQILKNSLGAWHSLGKLDIRRAWL